jgi:hypothetical protein
VLATAAGGTGELLESLPQCLCASRDARELGARLAALLAAPPMPQACAAAVAHLSWEHSSAALEACLAACVEAARR